MHEVEVNKEVGIYKQEIKEVIVCPYVFYSFSINSDGSASACYLDWGRKLIIGDAKFLSVKEIWEGNDMIRLQKLFLRKERKWHTVCRECGQMTHGSPDNIDEYTEILLKKII